MEDKDQKVIDSMADAMLEGYGEKKETAPPPMTRYWEESETSRRAKSRPLDDDLGDLDFGRGSGSSRTTSQTPSTTLHTTSKEGQGPYKPRYGAASATSQGGKPLAVGPLRQSLKKLTAADVDTLDMTRMLTKVKELLLEEFERQNWLLLGNAEAHMFRAAVDNNMKAALRAVAMKVATNDLMRDKTKAKPAG